jgi:hypothetical protein
MRKARGAARATNVSRPCALAFEVNDEGWPGGRGSPGFALRVMNSPHVPLRNIVSNIRSLALRDPAARARNGVQPRNADQARCRSWVNRFTLTVGQPLPILPQLRTCRCTAPTDAMCQQPTSLIARPYGALDMSIHFTKNHSFHVGKEAVALRQPQQVLPLRSVR